MKTQLLAIIVIISCYFSWIYIEQNYLKNVMYGISVQHIKMFRVLAVRQKPLDALFTFVSHLGDKLGIIGSIWVSVHFQNQAHAWIVGLLSAVCLLISQTVKSALREPRPFMITDQIQIADCTHVEFGNPSSHTFLSSAMFVTTVYLFYREYTYHKKVEQNLLHLLIMMNGIFVFVYIIGFSRVFKGVHTYNQITSGLIQGLLLTLLPSFVYYSELFKFYLTLKHRPWISIIINRFTFVFVVISGFALHIHWDTQANFKVPDQWLKNIQKQCPNLEDGQIDPEAINFKKLVQSFCILGTYLGAVFEQKFFESRKYNQFYQTSFLVSVQRLLLCSTLALPTFFIKDIPKLFMAEVTSEMTVLFKYFLMPTLQGFYLFAFTKPISIHFGLANLKTSEATIAGHDKEYLSIMCGTEIQADLYKHNQKDGECKQNKKSGSTSTRSQQKNGKRKTE